MDQLKKINVFYFPIQKHPVLIPLQSLLDRGYRFKGALRRSKKCAIFVFVLMATSKISCGQHQ